MFRSEPTGGEIAKGTFRKYQQSIDRWRKKMVPQLISEQKNQIQTSVKEMMSEDLTEVKKEIREEICNEML